MGFHEIIYPGKILVVGFSEIIYPTCETVGSSRIIDLSLHMHMSAAEVIWASTSWRLAEPLLCE